MKISRTPFSRRFNSLIPILFVTGVLLVGCASSETAHTDDTVSDTTVEPDSDVAPPVALDVLVEDTNPITDDMLPSEPDVPICAPDCDGKECGEDGCGDICGLCEDGIECQDGICKEPCTSDKGCENTGLKQCEQEGNGEQFCTEIEPGCLKWSEPVPCREGWACFGGECQDLCQPQCPPLWCGDNGCGGTCAPCLGGDQICVDDLCETDGDGDGYSESQDCDDGHPGINPGQEEAVYDWLDNDCDPATSDGDADGDGAICKCMDGDDCDDTDPLKYPGSVDWVGDGIDHNCDGHDGIDLDQDLYASIVSGGLDCDDLDPAIHPNAEDFEGDGIDVNCDGVDGYPPPGPADEKLCLVSGTAGDLVDCPLLLVGGEQGTPTPTGLQMVIHYNPAILVLENFYDVQCDEAQNCNDIPLALTGNQPNKTGHSFATYPFGTTLSPWGGTVSLVVLHLNDPQTPLSNAYLTFDQQVIGDAQIGLARFQLLQDLDGEAPTAINGTNVLGVSTEMQPISGDVHAGHIVLQNL